MQILVFGVGGVGGYFGGKLAQAGAKVSFVARGQNLKALRENGLTVKSYLGDFRIPQVVVSEKLSDFKTPDLVLLCTKSWQLEAVAKSLKPIIHKETVLLPLQNGANNYDKLAGVLPKSHVLAGLCKIISFVEAPGVISHPFFEPEIVFGEIDNQLSKRVIEIQNLFIDAGIKTVVPQNISLAVWQKFLYICTVSGLGGLTRVPIGTLRSDPFLRKLMMDTALEIQQLANAKNIPLTDRDVETIFRIIDSQDPQTTASMQRDIMAEKPSELDDFNGYITTEGEKFGIETPANSFIYHCLKPMEQRARKL
ncbi:MAG: 2-dehydropantoate 2-reductase [Flavobacteriaceae bacterium]|nr:2-dehydropantoate 2-reductase [Flavobacteriaceae bacterium]